MYLCPLLRIKKFQLEVITHIYYRFHSRVLPLDFCAETI